MTNPIIPRLAPSRDDTMPESGPVITVATAKIVRTVPTSPLLMPSPSVSVGVPHSSKNTITGPMLTQ